MWFLIFFSWVFIYQHFVCVFAAKIHLNSSNSIKMKRPSRTRRRRRHAPPPLTRHSSGTRSPRRSSSSFRTCSDLPTSRSRSDCWSTAALSIALPCPTWSSSRARFESYSFGPHRPSVFFLLYIFVRLLAEGDLFRGRQRDGRRRRPLSRRPFQHHIEQQLEKQHDHVDHVADDYGDCELQQFELVVRRARNAHEHRERVHGDHRFGGPLGRKCRHLAATHARSRYSIKRKQNTYKLIF